MFFCPFLRQELQIELSCVLLSFFPSGTSDTIEVCPFVFFSIRNFRHNWVVFVCPFFRQELQIQMSCVLLSFSPLRHFVEQIYFPYFVPLSFLLRLSFPFMFVHSGFSGSLRKFLSYSPTYLFPTSLCYPDCTLFGSARVNVMSISAHLVVSITWQKRNTPARKHSLKPPCKL